MKSKDKRTLKKEKRTPLS